MIDGDEFDFRGSQLNPVHIALEEAPEWVKRWKSNQSNGVKVCKS